MADFVGSVACPWALSACHGVHRPPVPRAGQTARPGNQEGRTMTEASVSFAGNLTDQAELSPWHGETCAAGDALLFASAAFAVPAPLGVAQPLPAVLANPTEPGLCHGYLLGQVPFWFGEGDLQGTSISDGVETSPAGTAPLLSAGEALAVPAVFGVVQSLPAVDSESAVQGLGQGVVLGQEPFRFSRATHKVHTRDRIPATWCRCSAGSCRTARPGTPGGTASGAPRAGAARRCGPPR